MTNEDLIREIESYIATGSYPTICNCWGWNDNPPEDMNKLTAFSTLSYLLECGYTPIDLEDYRNVPIVDQFLKRIDDEIEQQEEGL